jgi:hypothetical protein
VTMWAARRRHARRAARAPCGGPCSCSPRSRRRRPGARHRGWAASRARRRAPRLRPGGPARRHGPTFFSLSPRPASARQTVTGETATPRSASRQPCNSPNVASGCAVTRSRSGPRGAAICDGGRPAPRHRLARLVPAPPHLHDVARAHHQPFRNLAHARPAVAGRQHPTPQFRPGGLTPTPTHPRLQLNAGDLRLTDQGRAGSPKPIPAVRNRRCMTAD